MKRESKRRSRLHRVMTAIFLCGIFCGVLCNPAWSPGGIAHAQNQPTGEEYRVYEAALNLMAATPKADLHVAIYERTLSEKCDPGNDNPVFANGCTFFWVKPDTSDDVEQKLRARFHGLERSTWKHFVASNAASITLHDPLSTPWKHRFMGTTTPVDGSKEWDSPDMTIFLSRVGFNSKKTEAIVYILAFSYLDRTATTGDYLRFRAGPDKTWTLAGRVSYLKREDDAFAWLQPGAKSTRSVVEWRPVSLRNVFRQNTAEWK
jgi:hypothetical protein